MHRDTQSPAATVFNQQSGAVGALRRPGWTFQLAEGHVDFKTQKRIPKLSAAWYSEAPKRNAVV